MYNSFVDANNHENEGNRFDNYIKREWSAIYTRNRIGDSHLNIKRPLHNPTGTYNMEYGEYLKFSIVVIITFISYKYTLTYIVCLISTY